MLIGHESQWKFLINSFKQERLSQALLFTGEEKLGKKKTVVEFAKFINCEGEDKPCEKCNSCKKIQKGNFPDFNLVTPTKEKISIDEVRKLQKKLSLKASKSPIKIAVFDQAEKLTKQAQNCLLKTLEEPKGETLIVLVSSKPETLLNTITSRCEILKFYPVKLEDYEDHWSQKDEDTLKKVFSLSFGKPGKALELLENEELEKEVKRLKKVSKIVKFNIPKRISFGYNFSKKKNKENVISFLETLESFLRLGFIDKIGIEHKVNNFFSFNYPKWEIKDFKNSLNKVNNTKVLLARTNTSPQVSIEELMISLPNS